MKNKVLLFIGCILLVCVMVAAKFVNDEKKSENKIKDTATVIEHHTAKATFLFAR